jgi:hypothetical protein
MFLFLYLIISFFKLKSVVNVYEGIIIE